MDYLCGLPFLARTFYRLNTVFHFCIEYFRGFPLFAARSSPIAAKILIPENLIEYNDGFCGFDSPSHPRKAEIIFFHDLYWKGHQESPLQTWMSTSEDSVCWPQAWLSAKYNARILFARYDAGVRKSATEGLMRMFLVAENLRQDACSIYEEDCPIFLVGHGLGGLVIKELVRSMQDKLHELERGICTSKDLTESKDVLLIRLDLFLKNLKGVCYFNTPVLGSTLADPAEYFPDRGALLECLEMLSSNICVLNNWFRVWRRCRTIAIRAALPTEKFLWHGCWCNHVVDEGSARSDVDDLYTVTTDHFSVCKLSDPEKDSRMQRLTELIDLQLQATAQGHVTHVADSDENACVELVNNILGYLQTLEPGGGLQINRDCTENIRKFPILWSKLEDGFTNAGLVKTDEDKVVESWQPRTYVNTGEVVR